MNNRTDKADWIYLAYKDKVRRYINGKISNYHTAEDLVSSVFLKVYRSEKRFDENKSSISTWIYTITRNTVIDYFRTSKQTVELNEEMHIKDDFEDEILDKISLDSLADALEALPQRERDLILLHYYKEYTLKDIAQMMEISYPTAKNIHSRALAKLREILQG